METKKITIDDSGRIYMPENVQMRPFEIAGLFGVYVSTVKVNIKAVLSSGIVVPDSLHGAVVSGNTILPELYGPEMITALAFRIHSPQTEMFRKWVIRKVTTGCNPLPATLLIRLQASTLPN